VINGQQYDEEIFPQQQQDGHESDDSDYNQMLLLGSEQYIQ